MKASRKAAQKKWLSQKENRTHFCGPAHLLRSQAWRKAHSGYWRKAAKIGNYVVRGKLAKLVREFALQDVIDAIFSLVIGLISHLSGSALQDTIAKEIRRLMVAGHAILDHSSRKNAARRTSR